MSDTYTTPAAAIAAMKLSRTEEMEELKLFIYDYYKYVNGIRPRWMGLWGEGSEGWTLEALQGEADRIGADYVAMNEREEREAKERAERKMRKANRKAHAARVFNRQFNSLGQALAMAC